jgi:hypothetical protein
VDPTTPFEERWARWIADEDAAPHFARYFGARVPEHDAEALAGKLRELAAPTRELHLARMARSSRVWWRRFAARLQDAGTEPELRADRDR